MSAVYRALLLMLCSVSLYAGTENRTLALYAGKANGLDLPAIQSAQEELQRLFAPTGIDVVWKDPGTRKSDDIFDRVVVMSFDGACFDAVNASTILKNTQDSRITLADASVSNGRVLPFFRVDCGYLFQLLGPYLRPMNTQQRNVAVGRALGRVMAHEIYHIVGETTVHQSRGVAKESFSLQDLIGSKFDFDVAGLAQMRPPAPPSLAALWVRHGAEDAAELMELPER
jgi:hypothetical protein